MKQTILQISQNQNVKILQVKSMAVADYMMHNKIRRKKMWYAFDYSGRNIYKQTYSPVNQPGRATTNS